MGQDEQNRYLNQVELVARTDTTITDPMELRECLTQIRAKGVSETFGSYSPDVSGFSAPLFNADGEVIAALTIAVPISRALREKEQFAEHARNSATQISKILGYKAES